MELVILKVGCYTAYSLLMEIWFIYALISTVLSGIHSFVVKVAVVRGYSSSLMNGYMASFAAVIGLVVTGVIEGFVEFSWWMVIVALISGVVVLLSSNYRMDSLRYIDTTISLPIHKFISPLLALVLGIILFNEYLTGFEWLGIMIGILVPLLLITKAENIRQTDLRKGLILISVSALLSAIGAAINKVAADQFITSIFLFVSLTYVFSAILGIFLYKKRKPNSISTDIFDLKLLGLSFIGGVLVVIAFSTFMLSFVNGGSLAVVYTITSLYIVIPIVLSVIFYGEHWNYRKIMAVAFSLTAVFLMG